MDLYEPIAINMPGSDDSIMSPQSNENQTIRYSQCSVKT